MKGTTVHDTEKIQATNHNTANPTPAPDLAPTGHLPYIVAQARERVVQPQTDGARLTPAPPACPDGITWCDGNPLNHTDDDDHRHTGPEYTLNGTYLCDSGGFAAFQLAQWPDGQPHLVFQGTGLWPDLDLKQTRELKRDLTAHLIRLYATERHLTILLNPGKTPFEETDDEQLSSGALSVALAAIQVALEKTSDPAMTLRGLRNFLDIVQDEQP